MVTEPIASGHLTSLFQGMVSFKVIVIVIGYVIGIALLSFTLFSFYAFQCKTIGTVTSSILNFVLYIIIILSLCNNNYSGWRVIVIPKPFDNKPSHSMCCHLAITAGTKMVPIQ